MRAVNEMMGEWYPLLESTLRSDTMTRLGERLSKVKNMTPVWDEVFTAYELTPPSKVKVVILGQDPYPGKGQAHGLSFSSKSGVVPYSLEQMYRDLKLCDYDGRTRRSSNLTAWAKQGVLLLNTCLTTETGITFAHNGWGWETLTTATLQLIHFLPQPVVIMAWGSKAQSLIEATILPGDNRLILTAPHPAYERYAKGSYVGSKHFQKANEFLTFHQIEPIDWFRL